MPFLRIYRRRAATLSCRFKLMWTRASFFAVVFMATQAAGQSPLSAIDWLSDTVVAPPAPTGPATAATVTTELIDVAPLEALAIDAVGLLPPSLSGLPKDFWGSSPTFDLVELIETQALTLPRPARSLLHKIILAELDPPVDATPAHHLFLARIDLLLRFGALDEAQALLERAGPTEASIFRRWFDVSLLTGSEDRACATMRAAPDIAPTFSARIFCLARGNDWAAAALSLETARALNYLSEADANLMARFLDPELFDGEPIGTLPRPLTPLAYRMLQALGEAPTGSALPLAFAHAKLGRGEGWKPRIEAAERLARRGGIAPNQLFSIYTERRQAASGGVWDRVEAVQDFDIALLSGDSARVANALPAVDRTLGRLDLLPEFAQVYGERLAVYDLGGPAGILAQYVIAQSPFAEAAVVADKITDPILQALAHGARIEGQTGDDHLDALMSAFDPAQTDDLPRAIEALLDQRRFGEAALRALTLIDGPTPDANDLEVALRTLRRIGFEQDARDIALYYAVRYLRASKR